VINGHRHINRLDKIIWGLEFSSNCVHGSSNLVVQLGHNQAVQVQGKQSLGSLSLDFHSQGVLFEGSSNNSLEVFGTVIVGLEVNIGHNSIVILCRGEEGIVGQVVGNLGGELDWGLASENKGNIGLEMWDKLSTGGQGDALAMAISVLGFSLGDHGGGVLLVLERSDNLVLGAESVVNDHLHGVFLSLVDTVQFDLD